jgi:hypothetical protein
MFLSLLCILRSQQPLVTPRRRPSLYPRSHLLGLTHLPQSLESKKSITNCCNPQLASYIYYCCQTCHTTHAPIQSYQHQNQERTSAGKKGPDPNERPNLSSKNCLLRARSLLGSIVLCGCVLEAAAATQFKKILTLIMCQPLISIGEISPKREIYNLKT